MFCPNCGTKLSDDSVFCENCGTRVRDDTDVQSVPQSVPDGGNQYQYQNRPADMVQPAAEETGEKKRGGIPVIALAAVLVVAVIGAVFMLRGKAGGFGKNGNTGNDGQETTAAVMQETTTQVPETTAAAVQETMMQVPETTAAAVQETTAQVPETTAPVMQETTAQVPETAAETVQGVVQETREQVIETAAGPGGANVIEINNPGRAEQAPENQFVDEQVLTPEDFAAIARRLSTSDTAKAMDFEWLWQYVLSRKEDVGPLIMDPEEHIRITDDMQPLLNGGWKAYMFGEPGVYSSEGERYLNAEIETSGNSMLLTLNWKYFNDGSSRETITESGSSTYRGTFDPLEGTARFQSDDSMIEIEAFYTSPDLERQYAIGTFHWISGEIDRIGLMRELQF